MYETISQEEINALRDAVSALSFLLTDLEEAEMDRDPETDEVYASHADARRSLAELEKIGSHWLP
jgi:hypothetical protein